MNRQTPLETWLKTKGITVAEAMATCRKHRCVGGFTTLMQHDFTLPQLAISVARALKIPPKEAEPMGRAIDPASWAKHKGVERLDDINHDPEWFNKIPAGKNAGTPYWVDMIAVRNLLIQRGIDYVEWERDNSPLLRRCRTFATNSAVRMKNIQSLADLLHVPIRCILTTVNTIYEQQQTLQKPVTFKRVNDSPTKWCAIDGDLVQRLLKEKGITTRDAAKRYAEVDNAPRRSRKEMDVYRKALSHMTDGGCSLWATAEKFAAVLGVKPETIARRYTHAEYATIVVARRQAAKAKRSAAEIAIESEG